MVLELVRFFFDSCLFVLIWLVQLIIYPSFVYYDIKDLRPWHHRYSKRIGIIVAPLMIGQLVVVGLQNTNDFNWIELLSMILVLAAWFWTFLVFVPLHNRIGSGSIEPEILHKLVRWNWARTILWTIVFGLGIYSFLISGI